MPNVRTSVEGKRGCGYRKPGGIYLRSGDEPGVPCGRLPITLDVCPTCNGGIKQTRGWQWIDLTALIGDRPCRLDKCFSNCPAGIGSDLEQFRRVGLLWIGKAFYETPQDFLAEAEDMGISRRIAGVPHGFKVGETWVALAHPDGGTPIACHDPGYLLTDAHPADCETCHGTGLETRPGIFRVFKPSRIEYVVTGKETEEQLQRLEDRGFDLVRVVRDVDAAQDQGSRFVDDGDAQDVDDENPLGL
jgi:hypothetical protein